MHTKRKLVCAVLTLVLCLGLFAPMPALAAELYFTSVNDNCLPLTADTMPMRLGGTIYVPYSVFDSRTTGVDLEGLLSSYNRTNGRTVTLYNLRQILVFDLNTGTCRDDVTGETYSAWAVIRNNRPYVPLDMVCSFFGLSYSLNAIDQGYLVRIKSSAVVLSDVDFIDAAGDLINRRLREYNQSLTPAVDATPPVPNVPVQPDNSDDEVSTDVRTYLAFRCEDVQGAAAILNALDGRRIFGLFLLAPQALEDGDLIRRILGTGHSIGILAEGADLAQTQLLLEQGTVLLERAAHIRVTTAAVPREQRASLKEAGWVIWNETLSLAPSESVGANTFASNTLRRLAGRTYNTYLTLPGNANTGRILPSLLRLLEERRFVVSIPMETRL